MLNNLNQRLLFHIIRAASGHLPQGGEFGCCPSCSEEITRTADMPCVYAKQVTLPRKPSLTNDLRKAKIRHQKDLEAGNGSLELLNVIEMKYRHTDRVEMAVHISSTSYLKRYPDRD